ncbi:hypothetical protein HK104_001351 [Borealophlyctis nickersoniae]|nr:hypothetical protein HK104_001351 [Borealophlyctis nickersoniae]
MDTATFTSILQIPKLHTLSLSSCRWLTDEAFATLKEAPAAPKIRYLCLGQLESITNEGMLNLAISFPAVEVLVVHRLLGVRDAGIQAFVTACPALTWIKVIACQGLTLGVLDNHGFQSCMDCPVVHSPNRPTGLGFAYKKMT